MTKLKRYVIKHLHKFLLLYFILWLVLFEFILPVNNFLPKPSIVLLSFAALWKDYNLPINFLTTFSAIYISLIIAYFLAQYFGNFIFKRNHFVSEFLFSLHWFSIYVPWVVFGLFLIYWFPASPYIEFLFIFAVAFFSILIKMKEESVKVKREYIDAAVSLGADESTISKKVIWKEIQPKILKHFVPLHFNIWSLAIVFEFIKNGYGVGVIFRRALEYKDLSALFAVSLIIGAVVFAGAYVIKYFRKKICHWSLT